MRLVFDLDGTLCTETKGEYIMAKPMQDRIFVVNDLFDAGHTIVIHTGRHWDNLQFTYSQLALWGVKYHALVMGKPTADYIVDDKAVDFDKIKELL